MRWIPCQVLLVLALSTAHAADAWKTYTHEAPAFSIDHPATWDVTVAERFADASIGGHTLEGEADVTFEVELRDEPLRIMVFAYAIPPDCDTAELLDALREDAGEKGRLTRYEGIGGHDVLPSVRYETKDVGRAEILTYLFDLERLFLVHMNVPETWLEACRERYDHAVRSLETDLLARRPRLELPSAEAFATDLVKVIEATETLRNAEMIRLFDEGTDLLRKGLAQGRRIFFKLAQHKFRAMLDIDRNVALGQFALGLAHFYAWEMAAAHEQFREAVRLDQDLEPLVPLLWWDDFHQVPPLESFPPGGPWSISWHVRQDREFVFQSSEDITADGKAPGVFYYFGPPQMWVRVPKTDHSIWARVRLDGQESFLHMRSYGEDVNVWLRVEKDVLKLGQCGVTKPAWKVLKTVELPRRLSRDWHVAVLRLDGDYMEAFFDGVLVGRVRAPADFVMNSSETKGAISLHGKGRQMVDWVMMIRE